MADTKWNWQREDWPDFSYDIEKLAAIEAQYIKASGVSLGLLASFQDQDRSELSAQLIIDEALHTSEIEGELLNRESLQSSIMREFGLGENYVIAGIPPREAGIAKMMKILYAGYKHPLTHEMLLAWHDRLMHGRWKIRAGEYRTLKEEMRVVSGRFDKPRIHFIAPPSETIPREMDIFIDWFNRTAPDGTSPLMPLARAGIAHLHFVSIHPFEDGNGRISRALVTKILSQALDAPALNTLSSVINANKKAYYSALDVQAKGSEITPYLLYFAGAVLASQQLTIQKLKFLLAKAKFFHTFQNQLNSRQEKVVLRIFREGVNGFAGGLSVKNYISITKTSRATATRDLKDLVEKKALAKTGKLKSTRYTLNLEPFMVDWSFAPVMK